MKNNKIKKSKTNILLIIAIAVFIFSIINIENSFSSNEKFSLTDVEITNKSDTVEVNGISYEGETITNNIIFHKVGDIVTYKLTVKNNTEKTYTLNSIKNNNENEYITYVFDDYKGIIFNQAEEKSFYITAKYEKELKDISKRDQNFSANFSFNLEDENGEKKNENITINPSNNENNKEKPTKNTSNTENNKNNENNKELTTKPNTEKNNNSGKKEDTVDKKENKVNEENTKNNIEEIKNNKETIKAISTSPKTGDNVIFYIILSLIAFITIVITLFFNAKSKKNDKNSKKSNKNGKKLLGLILITLIMLPTLSKANNFLLKISMKNTISLQDKLIVNYIINGEEKSKIVKFGEKIEMPEAPKLDGYLFEGWILEDGTEYNLDEEITEDAKIIPKYVPIEYTIIYDLNGGETNNPSKFTVESENIVLNYPVKEGYSFIGWTGTGLDEITKDVTIYKGEIGNKQFVANYEKIEYQISYNLKGGKATNSNKYTIESESITLNNPEKEGYNFTGWTGTGLDEKTMEVTIEKRLNW